MTLKDLKKRITSSSSTLQQQTQSFDKLITSLRTAVENDGMLDKEATSYDDVFDAFRLSMCYYRFTESWSRFRQ
jgi:hypothetical protein